MEDGHVIDDDAISKHCKKFLGSYKIPKKIIVLAELPKTHVGKIDKKAKVYKE